MEDKPLRLSWTRLRSHLECPAKGQLIAEGHKAKASDVRMFFHGTVVDSAMRQWLSQDKPEPGWMSARVDEILDEEEVKARTTGDGVVKWRHLQDKEEVRQFCREAVTRLEKLLTVLCLPYDWQPAPRFTVQLTIPYLDGTPKVIELTGEIDLLVLKDGRLFVYDLKATRDNSYWRKVVGQLVFYEIAMRIMKGEWPLASALIQPMCDQQVVPFQFDEEQRRDMMTRIVSTATDIWRGNTLPKASSEGCRDCFVRHACPKYHVPGGHGRVQFPVLAQYPVVPAGG